VPENCSDTGERRLPITKKSVERKDRGVVACQPEPDGELKKTALQEKIIYWQEIIET
jgi:hypothetical protein